MAEGIRCAGVIGAGVMGGAIAAHLAGAGIRVHLLDIVPSEASDGQRSDLARKGLERQLRARPAAFYSPEAAELVQPGNLEDHLERLSECQLIIEAVPENLDIKKSLFERIAPVVDGAAVIASNTSGLSIKAMNESLPEALRPRFLVLHFFNPVRYMKLLEVVAAPKTAPDVLARMVRFGEFLGKGIVYGKDTTNFVANRIGVYNIMLTMHQMLERGLSIEEVDAIAGRPLGRPKSAAFNTSDIVGIDTMNHVARNCYDSLAGDSERDVFKMPTFVSELLEEGNLGRKTGAGFYKKSGKEILVRDVTTGEYRSQSPRAFASLTAGKAARGAGERIKALVGADDEAAQFAWAILSRTLVYSAKLVGEIADDVVNIDRAMRWGFNWDLGPFEVWDALGVQAVADRMNQDGLAVPEWVNGMLQSGRATFYTGAFGSRAYYNTAKKAASPVARHPKELTVAEFKQDKGRLVASNAGASLVDIDDGVLCLELHTKMNTLDADVISMVNLAAETAERSFRALVVANDAEHFSAGANLMMIAAPAQAGRWDTISEVIENLQGALQRLRYCAVPVVSAPSQYALGGGAELAMASDASQAYAESYMGLVEVGVGLIPAGCGCLRLVERFSVGCNGISGADSFPFIAQASLNIAMAKASSSAEEAKALRFLRPNDGISLNRSFLLYEAKQRALGLAGAGYRVPLRPRLLAAGHDAAATIGAKVWGMLEGQWASPHDALIANKVAHVLCGGTVASGTPLSEQHYLDLEREAFLQLCGESKTQERIEHMLKTGKPLRN